MKKTKKILSFILALVLFFAVTTIEDILSDGADGEDVEVHFIDVGQGDAILVKKGQESMVIDAGKNSNEKLIVNYIKRQNINKIKYVIGTHPHEDHIGGLDSVIDNFDIENVIMPNITTNTRTFESVLDSIVKKGLTITKAQSGKEYDLDGAKITILAPNSEEYSGLNDYSVVVKLTHGKTSFVFTGDAEKTSEKEMVEVYGSKLKADVLKLGHHGSTTSTTKDFFRLVDPDIAVITVGKDNGYGHPHKKIIDMLKKNDTALYRTDRHGTIIIKSDGNNLGVSTSESNN
ncbi:ComEC/Rec2 family competence protein [Wansuia hejianensis]|uniref:MBL fold metallo-hydrolase n=1 Tax=Wansuia hejianensis TaxID=2763667 RepID=A0A926F0S7_9FIRM|nr:ComEC/Rec2 family competence protein [Wansuia hejianensis]MBC8589794.1 MBL fold metallo-hydrolase [Wansuia hejianensis]